MNQAHFVASFAVSAQRNRTRLKCVCIRSLGGVIAPLASAANGKLFTYSRPGSVFSNETCHSSRVSGMLIKLFKRDRRVNDTSKKIESILNVSALTWRRGHHHGRFGRVNSWRALVSAGNVRKRGS